MMVHSFHASTQETEAGLVYVVNVQLSEGSKSVGAA